MEFIIGVTNVHVIWSMPARTVEGDLVNYSECWKGAWQGVRTHAWSHSHSLHGDWQGSRAVTQIGQAGIKLKISR